MTNEERWLKNYRLAKKYYEEHGNLLIPKNYVCKDEEGNEVKLGSWISTQRLAYKGNVSNKLNQKQIDLLNEIKMVWEIRNNEELIPNNWLKNYELAKKYYEKHGNLFIPQNYVCKDEEGNEVKLGNWISRQRQAYKGKNDSKLNKKQIELLNEIEMVWEIRNNEELIPSKWLKNYKLAQKYYKEHDNLLVPYDYVCRDEEGNEVKLGNWIHNQRQAYKGKGNYKLNQKQIELLNEIEMVWEIRNNEELIPNNWLKNYELAKKYYEEHGNLLIPTTYVCKDEEGNKVKLGIWINTQRQAYKRKNNRKLNQKQIDLLNEIEMVWEIRNNEELIPSKWLKKYELAKKYYEEHGNLLIPENYVCKDEDGNEVKLGIWINTQRRAYKRKNNSKLNQKQIELLNEIEIVWEVRSTEELISNKWLKNYELAKKYYEEHGDLLIPATYVCKDEDGNEVKLGFWISTQRQAYKGNGSHKLNQKQIDLLNKIEMVWEVKNNDELIPNNWLKNYELAKKYYEEYGNLLIPTTYVCKDEDGNEVKLGNWISTQRQAYKGNVNNKLNQKQIDLLNKIKMVWEIKNNEELITDKWFKNYELAKKYYEEHGDLLIPATYVCKDKNGKEVKLGLWINTQRRAYKRNNNRKLNLKQIELLNEIKMAWEVKNNDELIPSNWLKNYKLAKKYYEEYGDLLIPYNYVCKDEEGSIVKLGLWITTQRQAYKEKGSAKLNQKQIELLNKIEMVWKVKNNDELILSNWFKNYELAKKYYEEHGNLLIPQNYVCKDKNGKEIKLGLWINTQRQAYKGNGSHKLNQKQIDLLNEIEMVWEVVIRKDKMYNLDMIKNNNWKKYYLMLKEYKDTYGDLFILEDYVYKDSNLYNWLEVQKNVLSKKTETNKIKIGLLNDIDPNWRNVDIKNLSSYIEEEYMYYLYGLLDEKNVNILLNSGAFIYTDDKEIVKATEESFLSKIKLR